MSLDDAPPPEIRATLFPGFVGDMIGAVSAYAEVPPALPAMMGLGVVATAVQRVFVVEHSPEGYRQPLNLYLLTILDSGNRKSAALSAMAAPVYEWESDKHKAAEPDLARARSERETKKARLDFLRKQYARTQDSAHLREIEDIEDGLGSVPVPPRLLTDDTTPEKLAVLLSEQGERMSVLSAEGGLFDTLAGRYAKGVPNLNLVLKAHEGEPECVDRITRETIRLLRPTVTLGLATQGEVVASMAATSAFRGRGFSARFLHAA
ncbi:MAG: DUF3987 domain-containing protein, partial [Candidatus Methylomirabilis sp.]|nr:DUF3987 domain-containing protein [Deltaproteobacteria bacterium]